MNLLPLSEVYAGCVIVITTTKETALFKGIDEDGMVRTSKGLFIPEVCKVMGPQTSSRS